MTIRSKLYAAMAVTLAGLALTAGVGIWGMNRLSDRFDGVQQAADDRALALQVKFAIADFNGGRPPTATTGWPTPEPVANF
jgi:hypothetical protein